MSVPKFKKFNLDVYKPGKSRIRNIRDIIKLSANESALGVSPNAQSVIKSKDSKLFRYPDPQSKALRKTISKIFACDENKVICGAGSDEIIQMLCQLFLNPKDEVIVPRYSFLMYRIYANIVGAKVIFSEEVDYKISVKEILRKVTKKTKIVFIANPNNPTGTYLDYKELKLLRDKLRKNILLVVDDAYYEYMKNKDYKSGLDLFKSKENVFILRTFSKIYGLASLRVGWGYGSKKIIKELNKIKPPFNVNLIAQLAAEAALKDKNFINKSIKHNISEAKKIKNFLSKFNIYTNEVTANFLLLDFDNCFISAERFYRKLQAKGIILRNTYTGYKIKNRLRLTIGSVKENSKFMKATESILN